MSQAPESHPRRKAFGVTDEALATALQIACLVVFVTFWLMLLWPAAFGTRGTWWTRLRNVCSGWWVFNAIAGAPICVTLLIACRLRRPALQACTLAAGAAILALEAVCYIAPMMRPVPLLGAGYLILLGVFFEYCLLALLMFVLGLVAVFDADAVSRRPA